jgi:NAD(P)-dependent dehydrogenase (short-subunit alcohol dehydrogenase family)
MFHLSGRVAVIIGGTSGIGKAIALALAEQGANVIPTGRRSEQIHEVCNQIETAGGKTLRHPCDVTKRESMDKFRDTVVEQFHGTDILVYAAGCTARKPTVDVPDEEWAELIDANLTGALRAAQAFYPMLKASGQGRVIHIASLGSHLGFQEVTAYCAAKTGLLSLTRSLAVEWARDGICVNAIAPGIFPTELNSHLITGTARGQELLRRTPMARFGKPEELAGVAVLLAGPAASYITGQCIAVDGGYLASGVNT